MLTLFVSIVVPVFRDTPELDRLLGELVKDILSGHVEIIVVNGDYADTSLGALHKRYPAVRWINTGPGRGRQMNSGAEASTGRWLLFLHADARLDERWLVALSEADAQPDVVGGAFRLSIASGRRIARLIERGVAARVRWFRLPYGDQAFFVRRDVFEALGGYQLMPLMEDVDFIRRLDSTGRLFYPDVTVQVSARRWDRDGWFQRSFCNMALAVLYFLGVSPWRLAQWYYRTSPPCASQKNVGARNLCPAGISVIVPALNEEEAVADVIVEIPHFVDEVVVVDNGSTDSTAERARCAGATVVTEPRRGYGHACRAGLRAVRSAPDGVVVFLDADRTEYPADMVKLIKPILENGADLVLGERGGAERPWHAHLGTDLCVWLINRLWGSHYRDLGPFRAIRRSSLDRLEMIDETWGWTIEMQVKAAEAGLVVREIPVRQRTRIGYSKIAGTFSGTVRAGTRMLYTIWSLWRTRRVRVF